MHSTYFDCVWFHRFSLIARSTERCSATNDIVEIAANRLSDFRHLTGDAREVWQPDVEQMIKEFPDPFDIKKVVNHAVEIGADNSPAIGLPAILGIVQRDAGGEVLTNVGWL